ncbi:MAG: peptide chain release factor 2 [Candidatus Omnitrophica bacterium CG11_big_fil_rev_8_21_14_0_20_63_9]|nr:MAG: peptide chain release factor 2 [Candidatus Omnitrophica bacterium CG11_big_fil_rev_8_21_14_0_20_63_9]
MAANQAPDQFSDLRSRAAALTQRWDELRGIFDLEGLNAKIAGIEATMAQGNFWEDQARANQTVQSLKSLKSQRTPIERFEQGLRDVTELLGLTDESDRASLDQLGQELAALEALFGQLEIQRLLGGDIDAKHAILAVHSGAGGTESCDWTQMLLRMYRRWAEERGFVTEVIDLVPGEEAGVKSATIIVKGPYAYGYLQSEEGVHRLVRISPFDSNKRRHTSFASVDIVPESDEDAPVEIKEGDLRIDVYRSGGKGGQSVNTTDSAVRITHLPTGIVVQCQDERSQLQNKAKAMHVLKARLADAERRKREEQASKEYHAKQKIEWGSQIRSYVLHPYNMVKDHRTEHETGNSQAVLDGKLDPFMEAYLKWKAQPGSAT